MKLTILALLIISARGVEIGNALALSTEEEEFELDTALVLATAACDGGSNTFHETCRYTGNGFGACTQACKMQGSILQFKRQICNIRRINIPSLMTQIKHAGEGLQAAQKAGGYPWNCNDPSHLEGEFKDLPDEGSCPQAVSSEIDGLNNVECSQRCADDKYCSHVGYLKKGTALLTCTAGYSGLVQIGGEFRGSTNTCRAQCRSEDGCSFYDHRKDSSIWLSGKCRLYSGSSPSCNAPAVNTTIGGPISDNACRSDFLKARCKPLNYCEYKYKFGDVNLDRSCRLKSRPGAGLVETDDVVQKKNTRTSLRSDITIAATNSDEAYRRKSEVINYLKQKRSEKLVVGGRQDAGSQYMNNPFASKPSSKATLYEVKRTCKTWMLGTSAVSLCSPQASDGYEVAWKPPICNSRALSARQSARDTVAQYGDQIAREKQTIKNLERRLKGMENSLRYSACKVIFDVVVAIVDLIAGALCEIVELAITLAAWVVDKAIAIALTAAGFPLLLAVQTRPECAILATSNIGIAGKALMLAKNGLESAFCELGKDDSIGGYLKDSPVIQNDFNFNTCEAIELSSMLIKFGLNVVCGQFVSALTSLLMPLIMCNLPLRPNGQMCQVDGCIYS